ncbi:MAG: T9SS type A sorting domain-containing protein [Cyclobacteriaceae bacterium]
MKHFFSISFVLATFSLWSQSIDVSKREHKFDVMVNGTSISGYLFLPEDVLAPLDVVIAVHGSGGLVSDCDDSDEIPAFKSQFRFWRDSLPKTGRAIFFIESFCERGVDSFKSKTPPEDEILSPYQVRAEDVKQSARLLDNLTFTDDSGSEKSLIDDQVWIGWSHGAGAVIAAAYEVPDNTDAIVYDVSSSGDQYDYGPPLSTSFEGVKGVMAWYGGYNFFGYFKDGSDIFYEPIDGISIVTHCGSNDDICFKDSNEAFIQKIKDEGHDISRYVYDDVNHSFDNAKDDDSNEDQDGRDLARERAFNFFDEMFRDGDEQPPLGIVESETLAIYPNPAGNRLNLLLKTEKPSQYSIFDSSGKMVQAGTLRSFSTQIDIIDIAEGTYNIMLSTDDGVSKRFRFIKK